MRETSSAVRLRRLFHAAVTLTLAEGAGCTRRVDPNDFTTNACAGGELRPLEGATTSAPVDFLALRQEVDPAYASPAVPLFETIASTGTACATAADPAGCAEGLAALHSAVGWEPDVGPSFRALHRYVVFTRGDAVSAVTTLDELARFLGPLESPVEAAWIARERGYRLECDGANARRTATGFELRVLSGDDCGREAGIDEHVIAVGPNGEIAVRETLRVQDGNPGCINGRRPEGMRLAAAPPARDLGAYLARCAELEAASVYAFGRLARELLALGAPERLVRAARRSAREEVGHARVMARLARRFGGAVRKVRTGPLPLRAAYEVARENAVEGCVREAFGALQAVYQSRRARDPELRRALAAIARDETRHAALAWDVAAWIGARLTDGERAAVADARREAVDALRRELGAAPPADAVALAGVPDVGDARALHGAVAGALWPDGIARAISDRA